LTAFTVYFPWARGVNRVAVHLQPRANFGNDFDFVRIRLASRWSGTLNMRFPFLLTMSANMRMTLAADL